MLSNAIAALRKTCRVLLSSNAPEQLAAGFTIGMMIGHAEPIQATYASIFNLPLGPWLGFNNTIVIGSLLMGLYVAYPVFWFTRLLFKVVWRSPAEAAV